MTKIEKIETGHMENGKLIIDGITGWQVSLNGSIWSRHDTEEEAQVEARWLESDEYRLGV